MKQQTIKTNILQGKRYEFKTHINEIVLPREKAEIIEAFHVIIEPGNYTHLHSHEDTEQLYFIISGKGRAKVAQYNNEESEFQLIPGDVVFIPRGSQHQIFCTCNDEPLRYLCVDGFPLGKPQNEPTWESHYHAVVELQKSMKNL